MLRSIVYSRCIGSAFSIYLFILMPAFSLGRVAGAAAQKGPKYRATHKNKTYKNFFTSNKAPVNFKHFAGFELQSVYSHSPNFQSLKPFA